MFITSTIKISINPSNYGYYLKLGYTSIKCGELTEVKISDLSNGSHVKVGLQCPNCLSINYTAYCLYKKHYNDINDYMCRTCKRESNLLQRKGVKNVFQLDDIKNKIKETNIKRYGVDNPSKSAAIQKKKKISNNIKFGCDWPLSNTEIRYNINKTVLDKYGVVNISQLQYVKDKKMKTCIDNHGEPYFNFVPRYNIVSTVEFDKLSEYLNLHIKHACNGGEQKFFKYFVDGYIAEHNIILEWDEAEHRYRRDADIARQKYIEDNFNCKFIRIDQREWINNSIEGNSVKNYEYVKNMLSVIIKY